jgi:DNA-binding NarL/FixJ family response regulator
MFSVRILVVDDNDKWRLLISSILRTDPLFEVVSEVSDGLHAVKVAAQLQPAVVLLEVGLPGLDGLRAAGWIRKMACDAKIVFVSQESDSGIICAALQLGAWGYVLKSDIALDLATGIRSALQQRRFVSRSLTGYGFNHAK